MARSPWARRDRAPAAPVPPPPAAARLPLTACGHHAHPTFDRVFLHRMTEDALTQYLIDMLAGGRFEMADDNTFFFHDGGGELPFATIVTKDSALDNASKLDRPGVFRLDIGVSVQSFQALFGDAPGPFDGAAPDTLMPHPVHSGMHWVSVINPGAKTIERVKRLLVEARGLAMARKS
jgi:hypothetical protein